MKLLIAVLIGFFLFMVGIGIEFAGEKNFVVGLLNGVNMVLCFSLGALLFGRWLRD